MVTFVFGRVCVSLPAYLMFSDVPSAVADSNALVERLDFISKNMVSTNVMF